MVCPDGGVHDFRSIETTRQRLRRGKARWWCVGLTGLALAAAACGGPEEPDGLAVTQQGIQNFGNWNVIPNGALRWGAQVAASNNVGTTLFGIGVDNEVYTTNIHDPGGFGGNWRKISSFGIPCCDINDPKPSLAAAGFTGEPNGAGFLGNYFAIVYMHPIERQIYLRIQDQTGSSVVRDWSPIPSSVPLDRGVGLAWLPQNAVSGSRRTLAAVATAVSDHNVYIAGNTLSNGVYNHAAWGSFNPVAAGPVPGDGPVGGGPAIAWACPISSTGVSLVIAVQRSPFPESAGEEVLFTKFNASTIGWSGWTLAQNGLIRQGTTALAPGCGEFDSEMTLFGQGVDDRVYFSQQISGGPAAWTAIGTQIFNPELLGEGGMSRVGAGFSSGTVFLTTADWQVPYINSAFAP
jgi:hypothetical protein